MKKSIKTLSDILPLIVFFAAFKYQGVIFATGALVVATLVSVVALYIIEKKLPMMPLITAAVVVFFGALTMATSNDLFIKLKPTIVNIVFALILFAGILKGKGLLKYLMGSAISMDDKAWRDFSLRWAMFFVALAVINEIVWRSFPTDVWVNFKVFGILSITFIFMVTQIPFLKKNMVEGGS